MKFDLASADRAWSVDLCKVHANASLMDLPWREQVTPQTPAGRRATLRRDAKYDRYVRGVPDPPAQT